MAGKTFYRPFRDGEEHRFTKDLINNQIPSFYIEDGPKLISLLQEYYSFLHKGGNSESAAKNINKLNDIDEIRDYYDQYLEDSGGQYTSANTAWTTAANTFVTKVENLYKSNYLLNFPTNSVSFQHLIKHVLSIYRSKGSERAFKTLMRGIFNVETTIEFPYDKVLKPSSGIFKFDSYVQTIYEDEVLLFKETTITGAESGASAFVEDIVIRVIKGRIIAQLILNKGSLNGIFRHDEVITSDGTSSLNIRIIAGMREIQLTSNGSNYTAGDKVNILGNGLGGKAVVTETGNFAGRIKFTVENGGSGYTLSDVIKTVGPTSGTSASAKVSTLKDTEIINIVLDRIGAFAANSQITINEGPTFHTNSFINSVSVFTNPPIAGPALASGVRASYINNSNDVHLSTSIANNTIVNGTVITIGNTTTIHNEKLVVHDFFPGNNTIRFTAKTSAPASNSTAHVRIFAANTRFRLSANLAAANVSSKLNAAFGNAAATFGSISTITVIDAGSGYIVTPVATITNEDTSSLNIPDGAGGFKGRNAVIGTEIVRDSIITKVLIDDHGLGYTNTSITLSNPNDGGTQATGKFVIGGVGNSAASYIDVIGFPSENQRIQDSFFYQAFSYEAITDRAFEDYEKTMIALTHPAGTKLFGKFRNVGNIDAEPEMIIDITQAPTVAPNKSPAIFNNSALGSFILNETAF